MNESESQQSTIAQQKPVNKVRYEIFAVSVSILSVIVMTVLTVVLPTLLPVNWHRVPNYVIVPAMALYLGSASGVTYYVAFTVFDRIMIKVPQ